MIQEYILVITYPPSLVKLLAKVLLIKNFKPIIIFELIFRQLTVQIRSGYYVLETLYCSTYYVCVCPRQGVIEENVTNWMSYLFVKSDFAFSASSHTQKLHQDKSSHNEKCVVNWSYLGTRQCARLSSNLST